MRTLHINVLDKKATYLSRDGDIVCGNSDYMIEFAFDAEWDGYDEKTARFIWNGQYQDVKFVGTACYVPIVTHTSELRVGVYAGELSTTTSATISCQKSVLCDSSSQGGTIIVDGDSTIGAILPIPTANDNKKVLTAEDGKAKWKEPTGGANFLFANSKEELPDPSTVPENTVGLVPSEGAGGGGLPVVELETSVTMELAPLSEADSVKIAAIGFSNFILKASIELGGGSPTLPAMLPMSAMSPMAGVYGYGGAMANNGAIMTVSIEFAEGAGAIKMGMFTSQ